MKEGIKFSEETLEREREREREREIERERNRDNMKRDLYRLTIQTLFIVGLFYLIKSSSMVSHSLQANSMQKRGLKNLNSLKHLSEDDIYKLCLEGGICQRGREIFKYCNYSLETRKGNRSTLQWYLRLEDNSMMIVMAIEPS